jgi:hypothetical protein
MRRHVDVVRTDVSEEGIAPTIRVERVSKLGTGLAATLLLMLILTTATWHHIPEDGILQ